MLSIMFLFLSLSFSTFSYFHVGSEQTRRDQVCAEKRVLLHTQFTISYINDYGKKRILKKKPCLLLASPLHPQVCGTG